MEKLFLYLAIIALTNCGPERPTPKVSEDAVRQVLIRETGEKCASLFQFELNNKNSGNDSYKTSIINGKVHITGNSPVALCRGAYEYLRNTGKAIISWSGTNIDLAKKLPEGYNETATSPYKYRYYFNVVTNGYSTPYWDWPRWEKEIDWMAVHGLNMPLMGGAFEAILDRVFKKTGLTEQEINEYFTGPAHFPWNRMGNITGVNGPLPETFFKKQIELNHQILSRMKELNMHPIIQAFAGFVPNGIKRLYPDEKLRDLSWGGFQKQFNAHILEPGSQLYIKIGKMYIEEWEKEFGKGEFYLADSFNEMDVPLSQDSTLALKELSMFGSSVYQPIHDANPDAVWVMQGWTFPFQRDRKTGKLFWSPERLHALISKVPDDKLLILDLANEYNLLFWKIQPSWKMFDGFFGKQWIYSFIPNMGGKIPWNGVLETYATASIEALNYEKKRNLVGFGFAPEGIENNEIIYELLADMGWRNEKIKLEEWIPKYCEARYGSFPGEMKTAYDYFLKSCFGTFTDHPRFKYQFGPRRASMSGVSVNKSEEFSKGVEAFLNCKDALAGSKLYQYDAIEVSTQYLGLKVDELLFRYENSGKKDRTLLNEAIELLYTIDKLLESHPNLKLENWVSYARNLGDTPEEKNYYESNAKQLITIWGDRGQITDYAARVWSGLIKDYYVPRLKLFYEDWSRDKNSELLKWEQQWVKTPWTPSTEPFKNPVDKAFELIQAYKNKPVTK